MKHHQPKNEYLSGNWKTMPTLSGCKGSGDFIFSPSSLYRCTYMEPDVGLLNPASSCMEKVKDKKQPEQSTFHWLDKRKAKMNLNRKDKIKRKTCNKVVFPLPLRPNIKPKLQKTHVRSSLPHRASLKCISVFEILVD